MLFAGLTCVVVVSAAVDVVDDVVWSVGARCEVGLNRGWIDRLEEK